MRSLEAKISAAILNLIRARRQDSSSHEDQAATSVAVAPARLRAAQFSDFAAVADLKRRGGLNADSLENWDRLWRQNPALAANPVERPIGWVLEADGAIVGYLGNISLLYRYGGRPLTAVTAHGLVVDSPYRAMGVTLVAAFFRQKAVDLFISTSAIEAVGKIALAFKSSPVPQADYDTALFWVLRPYAFSRGLMRKLRIIPALTGVGGILAAVAIHLDKTVRRRRPRQAAVRLNVSDKSIREIEADFEDFWHEKQNEGFRLLADRSPAALRWHFEIPGDKGSARVLCCHEDKKLIGYVVVRSDTKPENSLRTSIIADMVAKNDDVEVVRALWSAAYDYAKREGSDVLEVLGFPPAIRDIFLSWNPYRRQYPACPFYYKAADLELHKGLQDGAVWYASPFDGDASLIRPSYSTSESPRVREAQAPRLPETLIPGILGHETTEVY